MTVWACALGVAMAPGAQAATVGVRAHPSDPYAGDAFVFEAEPGELNRLTVLLSFDVRSYHGTWTFMDAGANLAAGPGCRVADPHTVRCEDPPSGQGPRAYAAALLGDGADEARFAPATAVPSDENWKLHVAGGPGDDRLFGVPRGDGGEGNDELRAGRRGGQLAGGTGDDVLVGDGDSFIGGGPGNDRLVGGPRDDVLDGGGGQDVLQGGRGNDSLTDGDRTGAAGDLAPGPDLLDGGGQASDTITYEQRTGTVVVDLADAAPDGEAGEGDTLLGFRDVDGGDGDDYLAGDRHPNHLFGAGGSDRLVGRGGGDRLGQGAGGGTPSCGGGEDVVVAHSSVEMLERACERVDAWPQGIHGVTLPAHPARTSRSSVRYILACPISFFGDETFGSRQRCSGTVRLREAAGRRRLLGRGQLPEGRWNRRPVTVKLTRLGRRLARRPTGVAATTQIALRAFWPTRGGRRLHDARWMVLLRVPP